VPEKEDGNVGGSLAANLLSEMINVRNDAGNVGIGSMNSLLLMSKNVNELGNVGNVPVKPYRCF